MLFTVGGFTVKVKIAPITASTAAIINVGFKPPAFATIIGPTNAAVHMFDKQLRSFHLNF